ncbi:putative membrane protein [Pseudonocardia hierapolitana]|uniref:Putative membrane protein n=2 Tax=Pseudonocardia hierapolitana TaxID=1128676 RepID=A0A561SKT2_9PSEU|nr:putative membrane protein [Pseudonocardia hierapolitana]
MTFTETMEHVATGVELLGVGVLVVGIAWSGVRAAIGWVHTSDGRRTYAELRESIGGSLLLGLEILVAADLIKTVAVAPTVDNVLVLGLIVLIRTFLSFSLQIEIDGALPWRRGRREAGSIRGASPRGS